MPIEMTSVDNPKRVEEIAQAMFDALTSYNKKNTGLFTRADVFGAISLLVCEISKIAKDQYTKEHGYDVGRNIDVSILLTIANQMGIGIKLTEVD